MNKISNNLYLILFLFVLLAYSVISVTTKEYSTVVDNKTAMVNKINITSTLMQNEYSVSIPIYYNTINNMVVYKLSNGNDFSEVEEYTPDAFKDEGLLYIIKNGYTGTKENIDEEKYYITQLAINKYLNIGTVDGSEAQIEEVNNIVNEALNVIDKDPLNVYMDIKSSVLNKVGEYYESNLITVHSNDKLVKYEISVNNDELIYNITNKDNEIIDYVRSGDEFKIRIPITAANDNINFMLMLNGEKSYDTSYKYNSIANDLPSIVIGNIYSEKVKASSSLNLTNDSNKNNSYNNIKINVINGNKKSLSDAMLILKDYNGNTVDSWTSNGKEHIISKLLSGKYIISEIKAPNGYKKSSDIAIDVNNKTDLINVVNNKNITTINVIDENNNFIENANISIEDENGNIIDSFISNNKPYIINGLLDGNYVIKQSNILNNYVKTNNIKFEINSNSDTINNINVINKKTSLTVNVKDNKNNNIENAHITIVDKDYNIINKWITNKNSKVLKGLNYGLYYVFIDSVPDKYTKDDKVEEIEITSLSNNEIITFNNELNNSNTECKLLLKTIDKDTKENITGNIYQILDESNNIITEFESNDKINEISLPNEGTYILKQLSTKEGYKEEKVLSVINVNEDNKLFKLTKEYTSTNINETWISSFVSKIILLLGTSLTFIGIFIFYKNYILKDKIDN